MVKKGTPKKRNPQDTTLRNLRALTKRLAALEFRVHYLENPGAALR